MEGRFLDYEILRWFLCWATIPSEDFVSGLNPQQDVFVELPAKPDLMTEFEKGERA